MGTVVGTVAIGIDIGQKHDPTAVCVVEMDERPGLKHGTTVNHHTVRYLERLPLGTSYPAVASRLAAIVANVQEMVYHDASLTPTIWLDATGVGQPVVDLLRDAGVSVTPVYFTHGDRLTEDKTSGQVSMGKALLVSKLQVLLQSALLHLPKTSEAKTLAKELVDYEIHIDDKANDTYGAFRVGAHDDLVSALGLAVLAAQRNMRAGVWLI